MFLSWKKLAFSPQAQSEKMDLYCMCDSKDPHGLLTLQSTF